VIDKILYSRELPKIETSLEESKNQEILPIE
jgi:hypothetical protein